MAKVYEGHRKETTRKGAPVNPAGRSIMNIGRGASKFRPYRLSDGRRYPVTVTKRPVS